MIDLTKIFDLNYVAVLLPLPCGCVVDNSVRAQDGVIECPWCCATFDSMDFGLWVNSDCVPPVFLGDGPPSMIRCNDEVHEVHGESPGGFPVVRIGEDNYQVTRFEWVSN